MSKRNRRKRYTSAPVAAAQKDVSGGTFWGPGSTGMFTGAGVVGRNTNLSRTEWGAATAYQIMPEVNRAMSLRADALGSLPWQVFNRDANGAEHIIASSEDVTPRHPLARAFAQTIRDNNHSLLSLMCYSHDLAGEIFVQKTFELDTGRGVNWLNPLATEPLLSGGEITSFQYSQMYGGKSEMFKPREVAYYHNWNPYNDFRGQGLTQVVMQKINMARNLDDFIEDFFGNNARPSVIVSPTDDEPFTQNQKEKLQQQMDVFLKGRGNQFATYVSPVNAKYTPLDQPEIGKHYTIAPELSQYIYTIYGVPKALAGDDSGTQYKTGDDVKVAFFQITIIPLSTHIERFINAAIMPYFDTSGAYFRFDTTEFDLVSSDDEKRVKIASDAYQSGLWTRNKSLEYSKQEKPASIDFLLIEGIPIPIIEVPNYWKYKMLVRPAPQEAGAIGQELGVNTPAQALDVLNAGSGGLTAGGGKTIVVHTHAHTHDESPTQVIAGKATQTTAEDELKAWAKKSTKSWKAHFEPIHLRGDLGDWITENIVASNGDLETVKTVFVTARERLAVKAIQATRLDFEGEFDDLLARAQAERIDRRTFSSTLRYFLNKFGKMAYADGLKDGGVDEPPDDDDLSNIAMMLADQSAYVSNFGQTLFYGDGISPAEAKLKASQWWGGSIQPFYDAGGISANGNAMKEFAGESGVDSCPECVALVGQRHRFKDFARKGYMPPYGENLSCNGGKHCKHVLVTVTGRARGNWI